MSTAPQPSPLFPRRNRWIRRLDALTALVVLLNFGVVLFDLGYIRFRDVYLRYLPQLTQHYDPVKGIEPFRETAQYLAVVDDLAKRGIANPETNRLLADLQFRSVAMIEEDPFRLAHKSGGLEKLKNRMRQHMARDSAKEAFRQFWSLQHLNAQNWPQELRYFDQNFRPIIAANYYRPLDESGEFVDQFWQIDIWFVGFFAADLLIRILWIRQRYRKRWDDALLWRWYDLLLLLPFWRILRIIPVTIRLHQSGWVNLHNIQQQVNRNLAENIAGEVTELVLLQTFSVVQGSIKQGALRQLLKEPLAMATANEVDEVAMISRHLIEVVTQTVLPNLEPDLGRVIQHLVQQAIAQTPFSKMLPPLLPHPTLDQLSTDLSKQISHQVLQALTTLLNGAAADEAGQHLMKTLGQTALTSLQTGLNQQQTLTEIESLAVSWIEDLKLTLIQRLKAQDPQQTLTDANAIHWRQASVSADVSPHHLPGSSIQQSSRRLR